MSPMLNSDHFYSGLCSSNPQLEVRLKALQAVNGLEEKMDIQPEVHQSDTYFKENPIMKIVEPLSLLYE